MCDEYQDTSYVQEGILLRLAERHGNICVVGDEDQSLYRFRGASVQNILGFSRRFHDCRVVELNVNYRSHPSIVRAYDGWMASADWSNPDPGGRPFRHAKTIIPHDPKKYDDYPAVIAIDGQDPEDEGRQLAQLLRFLKGRRVIAGYDQVALLLHSVRDEVAGPYQDSLECAGIPVRCAPAGSGRGTGGRQRAAGGVDHHDGPPGQGPGMAGGDRGFPGLPRLQRGPGGPQFGPLLPAVGLGARPAHCGLRPHAPVLRGLQPAPGPAGAHRQRPGTPPLRSHLGGRPPLD